MSTVFIYKIGTFPPWHAFWLTNLLNNRRKRRTGVEGATTPFPNDGSSVKEGWRRKKRSGCLLFPLFHLSAPPPIFDSPPPLFCGEGGEVEYGSEGIGRFRCRRRCAQCCLTRFHPKNSIQAVALEAAASSSSS